ncbi:flagellar basal body-associated FliL family protein [Simiduia sp. 21SJ11W-1]|uniref:flagellar basal body-associated FliL family protein n=1 Tax=Simiduia sp. 21SJ11W-1 TaxID=2909669 RepID=UPI00209DC8B1|nr:flagellar basal body-associated FliL family protein [Simiduia sp. 21SJ11W-1]UTA48032.1 flagellar basal body-associated FliL family protein [Simiduia sp. 21SJ11W-1]
MAPKKFSLIVFICLVAVLLAAPGYGQDEEGEAAAKPEALYIPLQPPFVVNYGGPGRLRYLKAELTVRVHDVGAAQSVRHHMPAIRDALVSLMSRQEELVIDTQEGKEQMRKDALGAIQTVIETEEGEDSGVVDVFFDNLIVQR